MGTREGGEDTRSRPAWGARRCTESADAGSLDATSARAGRARTGLGRARCDLSRRDGTAKRTKKP
ncbi:hypothetical protein LA76x_0632 [Lysobacter antibioticus]|uniref:Uncharacterized protein n=1 Tax=Lysobacter antibioticus TaxID=84531 RepID=A0A0S2F5H2_LYSAN|nr:hypothetical protein LA76x_0632 [Lysobacter antibioticus]